MKHLKTYESKEDRATMIDKLCKMGYDKSECETMSYEELCDCMNSEEISAPEEIIEEGVFKKVGETIGIKSIDRKIDDIFGISDNNFLPTPKLNIFIEQAEKNGILEAKPNSRKIESALRTVREIGYGIKNLAGEVDVNKYGQYCICNGEYAINSLSKNLDWYNYSGSRASISSDKKLLATYLVSRAIHHLHTGTGKCGAGFNFNLFKKLFVEDKVDEGVFKRMGEVIGIRTMDRRLDDVFGFTDSSFEPTSKLKLYISQGFERNSIPTDDMKTIESALRSARDIKYGIKFFKDEPELKTMSGTDDDKKIATYLIKRALHSIHTTSGGGHEFGKRPEISGIKDNTSQSKYKHLKEFESFKINEEEGIFKKFFTGHGTAEEKAQAKKKFMDALESAELDLKKNPDDYAQSGNWEVTKKKLMDQAKNNNYKGGLRVQRGGRDHRIFIIYDEGASGFQRIAGSAAGDVRK